jgi:hypothetical protein
MDKLCPICFGIAASFFRYVATVIWRCPVQAFVCRASRSIPIAAIAIPPTTAPVTPSITKTSAIRGWFDIMNDLVDLNRVCTQDFDAALRLTAQGFNGCNGAKDDADVLMDRLLAAAKPVAVIVLGPDHSDARSGNGRLMVASGIEAS